MNERSTGNEQHLLNKMIVSKGFWLYFFSFIIAPLGYIIRIIVSGDLSIQELGILYGIVGLVGLLGAYNDVGMTESLNHFIPIFSVEKRYDKIKAALVYAFIVQMITGILLAFLLYAGSTRLAEAYFKAPAATKALKLFSLYFLGYNFFQIATTLYMATVGTFEAKIVDFSKMLATTLLVIAVFTLGKGSLEAYSLSFVAGLYIAIIIALCIFFRCYYATYIKGVPLLRSAKLFTEIGRYALLVFLGASAGMLLAQADLQMVIYFLGTKAGGYYTNYLSIISISIFLLTPIFSLLLPLMSELYARKDWQKIKNLKTTFDTHFIIVSVACSIFFFVFAEKIGYVLFGSEYTTSGAIVRFSVPFLVFNLLLQVNFTLLASIGKIKTRALIIVSALICNIVANYYLIGVMGFYGAALSTGISRLFMWVLSTLDVPKHIRSTIHRKMVLLNGIVFALLGVLFHYSLDRIYRTSRLHSLGNITVYAILYALTFWLLNKKGITKIFSLYAQKPGNPSG